MEPRPRAVRLAGLADEAFPRRELGGQARARCRTRPPPNEKTPSPRGIDHSNTERGQAGRPILNGRSERARVAAVCSSDNRVRTGQSG